MRHRTAWCSVLLTARFLGVLLPGTLAAGELRAQNPAEGTPENASACGLGLVLSGGGARSIAHLGVLQVLEEHGVRPDCIVGASMGAVIGSLYATGHSHAAIKALLSGLSWSTMYIDSHNRRLRPLLHRLERQRAGARLGITVDGLRAPRSLLSDNMANRLLIEHLAPANFDAGRQFDALSIPFRTLGTDLLSGDRVELLAGDLARAVRASMSVPLAYAPVPWEGALLVDGGLADNVPVSLAKEMGAEFTLAVDASTPIDESVNPDLFGVTERIIDLLSAATNSRYGEAADVTIVPDLEGHSFADYSRIDELIAAGRKAAEAALDSIPERFKRRPLVTRSPTDHHAFGQRVVRGVEVTGNVYLSDRAIRREFRAHVGEVFDWQQTLADLDHLYASGLLQSAWLDLAPDGPNGIRLLLFVQEEYRHTVDLGLAYQSDDQAQAMVRFETRSLFGPGDRLQVGGAASAKDLRLDVRLHGEQFLGAHVGYLVDVELHQEKPKVFEAGEFVSRAEFRRRHVALRANLPFGFNHLLQLGVRAGEVETIERLGIPYVAETRPHRVLTANYVWDSLSSLAAPVRGHRYSVQAERNLEGLGGSSPYWRVRIDGISAVQLGGVNLTGRLLYGYSSSTLPIYDQFRVGGPELVPGLARDELWGNQALAASGELGIDFASVARLYGRLGAGGVWQRRTDISVETTIVGGGLGLTVATPIGPLQLDYGWAEGNRNRFYIAIGWQ